MIYVLFENGLILAFFDKIENAVNEAKCRTVKRGQDQKMWRKLFQIGAFEVKDRGSNKRT